jgi:hypothetical protein
VSFTPPAGTWIPSAPVVWTGSAFTRYCPPASQPAVNTINFTTSGSTSDVRIQMFATSGNSYLRLGSATEFVGSVACSGACSLTVKSPSGSQPVSICKGTSSPDVCGSSVNITVP